MTFNGCLDRCDAALVAGWAINPSDHAQKVTVEIFSGKRLLGRCVASQYRPDLAKAGLGDGAVAFSFTPPPGLQDADIRAIRAKVPGSGYMFEWGMPMPVLDVEIADIYRLKNRPGSGVSKRFKTCILHIGTEKTGSTTLQSFLYDNRRSFEQAGYFVPLSLAPEAGARGVNHYCLPTLAMDDRDFDDDLRRSAAITDASALLAYRRMMFSNFCYEVDVAPSAADTLLLSSEHCQSRLSSVQSVRHLKRFLDPFCETFRIVVYLRPQHEVAISRFGMFVRAGLTNIDMFPPFPPPLGYDKIINTPLSYFDYADLLDRWAQIFGENAIDVRLFSPSTLLNGDIIDDFIVGLDVSKDAMVRPPVQNNNVSAAAQDFLLRLHADPASRSLSPGVLQAFTDILRARFPGSGVPPIRHEAETFFAQFDGGNETVRARWFPHRQHLFDYDFSSYPAERNALLQQSDVIFTEILQTLAAG